MMIVQKNIVENLFSTMYYIEKKKIMFHTFSSGVEVLGSEPGKLRVEDYPQNTGKQILWRDSVQAMRNCCSVRGFKKSPKSESVSAQWRVVHYFDLWWAL